MAPERPAPGRRWQDPAGVLKVYAPSSGCCLRQRTCFRCPQAAVRRKAPCRPACAERPECRPPCLRSFPECSREVSGHEFRVCRCISRASRIAGKRARSRRRNAAKVYSKAVFAVGSPMPAQRLVNPQKAQLSSTNRVGADQSRNAAEEFWFRSVSSMPVGFGDAPRWVVRERASLVSGFAGQEDSAVNRPGVRVVFRCHSACCPHVVGGCWQLAELLVFALDSD